MITSTKLAHNKFGAQILQAALGKSAREIFYLSPLGNDGTSPARGGIPIIFPQFGSLGSLRKHGFARNAIWHLLRQDPTGVTYILDIQAGVFEDWPYSAVLTLTVTIERNLLTLSLQVKNTGDKIFSWTGGLHPYFFLSEKKTSRICGLENIPFIENFPCDLDPALNLDFSSSPFERLYLQAPTLQLSTSDFDLTLSSTGFNNWMIWNPGRHLAAQLSDLPHEDWGRFVCIEPVCADIPVTLSPDQCFEGVFTVTYQPLES